MLSIPVIAGLNGAGLGNWARHAALIEEAGADAVELNAYFVPTDPARPAPRSNSDISTWWPPYATRFRSLWP